MSACLVAPVWSNAVEFAEYRAMGRSLLDQQAWCWGQDIRNPRHNLLLKFGFQRARQQETVGHGSRYRLVLSPTARLLLWGHGAYLGIDGLGGLYLGRFDFLPLRTSLPDLPEAIWTVDGLPDLRGTRTGADARPTAYLLSSLLRWIGAYETWVLRSEGMAYRRQCLAGWQRPQLAPHLVPGRWRDLANDVGLYLEGQTQGSR